VNYIKYGFAAILFCISGIVFASDGQLIKYPPVKDITLPNGLRVMLIEQHQQQTISYRLLVRTGRADEPIGREGIASLTADILQEGTVTKTSDQIADEIAGIGSSLSVSQYPAYVVFGMDVIKQYSQNGLELFSDIIINPSFSSQGFKRIKNKMLNDVDLDQTDNDTIAFNNGRNVLFGSENPLGRTNTRKSVQAVTLNDVQDFYRNHYCPNNSILLVIGDFADGQMLMDLTMKFGHWQPTEIAHRFQTSPDFSKKGRIRIVDKPGMTQAIFYLNQWATESTDSNYYSYLVANYVLGGSDFSSRLVKAVRAKGGMTYHIGSRCDIHSDYGVLSISTSTRNQELLNAYNVIRQEMEKLINTGITEEELQKAKDYISGSIPLQLESPAQVAGKILNAIMQGFTIEDLSKEVAGFNSVTVDDVNRVIKEYMRPERLNVVIVCDVKKVESQLTQIGEYEKTNYKDSPCK